MALPPGHLRAALIDDIPIHGLLGIDVVAGADPSAVSLPDLPETRNHLGGQAGAGLFGVAEAASAAAVFDGLGSDSQGVFAVPSGGAIHFRRPGVGGVVARARMAEDPFEIVTRVRAGETVEIAVPVTVTDKQGRVVAEADITWHFAPARPSTA